MKKIILIAPFLILTNMVFAQQKTYDIISYTAPAGWTEKAAEGNISYSKVDGGSWAQIAVYGHRSSDGDIQSDFNKDWQELVANGRNISAPEKTEPKTEDGFSVMSGTGIWHYNSADVASMLTVYSNKTICFAVLCNTTAQPYLKDYTKLIASLDIKKNTGAPIKESIGNISSALVGIWSDNLLETSGYANNMPQYTAGYFRREYKLNADGTYLFLYKTWSAFMKPIIFGYETGRWSAKGNTLTITPKQGRNEEWTKAASGRNSEWGSRVKSEAGKPQAFTYRYEIKSYSGSGSIALILYFASPTGREATQQTDRSYSRGAKLLIDLPPGVKIN